MAKYHLNTETTLGIVYFAVCLFLLFLVALPLSPAWRIKLQKVLNHLSYYLAIFSILPLYIIYGAIKTLNRLAEQHPASPGPFHNPHLIDKHKGKVLKQQRNIFIGLLGIVLSLLFFRFSRMLNAIALEETKPTQKTVDVSSVKIGNAAAKKEDAPEINQRKKSKKTE